jgi:hypothetical protein
MALTKRFLEETGPLAIRGQLEEVLNMVNWPTVEA